MTVFWVIFYRTGYGLENPVKEFNFHPTLMVAGYITFAGFCKWKLKITHSVDVNWQTLYFHSYTAVLLYRICRCCSNLIVKLCHTFFHACAVPCIVLGFLAVFDSKNRSEVPQAHFYSLHSWLGFICMGLFAFQFVIGFFRLDWSPFGLNCTRVIWLLNLFPFKQLPRLAVLRKCHLQIPLHNGTDSCKHRCCYLLTSHRCCRYRIHWEGFTWTWVSFTFIINDRLKTLNVEISSL